jgi:AraC family transcriptional regulator
MTMAAEKRGVIFQSASLVIRDVRCTLDNEMPGPEEWCESHDIVLVRSGLFTRTTGRDVLAADPNHVMFFTRHQPYRVAHPAPWGDTCTTLSLQADDLLDAVRSHAPADAERDEAPFAFAWALSSSRAMLLHQHLLGGLRREALTPLAVEDLTFDLVDDLLGAAYACFRGADRRSPPGARMRNRTLVEAAKLLIARDVQRPPRLGRLAETVGCSPFHLSRLFHRETGLPLRRYLDRCRLRTALERLAAGEPDLTNLALDLGYADHSHFSNAFRREFDMPPSEFRRRATGKLLRDARKNLQA